jgi:CheY-like chemotaxis protein
MFAHFYASYEKGNPHMNLTETLQQELEDPNLTINERVLLRCQTAAEFIHRGQYEAARDALGDLWCGVGQHPNVEKLKKATAAEVLLQSGALSSGMGSARNMSGAQEKAKDLISEAQRLFESLKLPVKVAEAQSELSICYWRLGAFDEARVVQDGAAKTIGDKNDELKARILIRRALIETWACRYHDACDVLNQAEAFFKKLPDPLKGRWHIQMGLVLRRLGMAEGRADYLDRAIIEYTAAIYHCEQSQNARYCAIALNNLAFLLYHVGRYTEAHEHLDRAVEIFSRLKDAGTLAQVNETRARVLVAEQRYEEARAVIERAVRDFEVGGEQSCLADALTIQATVLARLGEFEESLGVFERAVLVAAEAGALENAGHAALSLIEEHGATRLSEFDAYAAYKRADEFLKGTQDAEDISRLRGCSRVVMRRIMGTQLSEKGFSLYDALHNYEARFIEASLKRTGGRISQAAKMLGLSHQTLSNILKNRHRKLQSKRLPPSPRRRSILRGAAGARPLKAKTISILYVEDNRMVAEAVKETLTQEGYCVEVYADGRSAVDMLRSQKQYDLLIFDHDLPGISGIKLAQHARSLPHRRRTPIMMFSASNVASEAYRAGVNLFLRKPEETLQLTANIKRLLAS